jgi:predicted DNA-binding transcriptional regulator YafY
MVIRLEGIAPYRQKAKRKWIDFEMNENLKGLSFIIPIYNAIKNEIVLTIDYRPYNRSENLSMTIHPYLLKEYHNRWFLIGYNSELEKISHLALDRIEGIAFSEQSFLLNMKYRESDYFENVLGITIPEKAEPEIIELKLTPERAPYIKTKPIHSSQTIVEDDESGMVIRLRLIINKELISELLSYCKDLKVISPKHLAQMIKDDLRKAQESYTE